MLSWVATEMRTGRIITDLPDLDVDAVSTVLGAYTSTSGSLPVPTAPEGWLRATLHGATVYHLLDDPQDGTDPVPLWGGFVTRRVRSHEDTVSLPIASLEAYLDRCFVGDVTYTGVGQAAIVADLIDQFVNDGSITIRVEQVGGAGTPRDRTYEAASDKTVLSVLTELYGVQGGPEWTIGWEWQHSPERITPVLYVGDRIGSAPAEGFGPSVTFEMPGSVSAVEFTEDYSAGSGATDVMAVSSASAGARPESPRQTSGDTERPTFQHRFTPSTSITNTATLTAHAQRALAEMASGARTLTLTAIDDGTNRLGIDWWLGDTVGFEIGGIDSAGAEMVPSFPGGLSGEARVLGWSMSLKEPRTVTPVLVLED